MKHIACLASILLAIALSACGGGGGESPEPASLLGGQPSAQAITALSRTGPVATAAADRSGDLLLDRIDVLLATAATVAEVNAAAQAVGATAFALSRTGSPYLTLMVPRQANGAALAALAQKLRAQPGIVFASPGRQMAALWLPGEGDGSPQPSDMLGHLLPARFPAAWNAAFSATGQRLRTTGHCASSRTTVIVVDYFQSNPDLDQLAAFAGTQAHGLMDSGPDDHGWQVAATLAATFDATAPTGATPLPDCVDFALVDVTGQSYLGILALLNDAILAEPATARLIVNASIGFGKKFCGPNLDLLCTAENLNAAPADLLEIEAGYRINAAMYWAELTSAALDERLLMVQAAGNEAASLPSNGGIGLLYQGMRWANLVSPFALATRLDALDELYSTSSTMANDLWTSASHPSLLPSAGLLQDMKDQLALRVTRIPDMQNMLLVGSATFGETAQNVTQSAFTNEGAYVLAVGEAVVGLGGRLQDGTSFAAPQVAGLAAYLWSISELGNRPASETRALIQATTAPNLLLDAYAATAALDALTSIAAPGIRAALLDVTGDGLFDEQDLQRYAQAYGLGNPNTPSIPPRRDYGRFDLNGDGATGGIPIMAFDLDHTPFGRLESPHIAAIDRQIEGYPITINEAALSDIQILCHYAYSPLYANGAPTPAQEAARTSILGPDHCVGARLNTLFPTQVTGPATLDVTVEVPSGNGQYAKAPNMLVEFTPSCGSVSPTSGRTDAEGGISVTVTPTGCTASVSVTAEARANETATVLARGTATATVGAGSTLSYMNISTGQPAGTILAVLYDGYGETRFSGPIGDAANVMAQVNAALSGVTEVLWDVAIQLWEPAAITLNASALAVRGNLSVFGQPTACGAAVAVTIGPVEESVYAGGCLDRAAVVVGDVGKSIVVVGNDARIDIRAGAVRQYIQIGTSQPVKSMVIQVQAAASGGLWVSNSTDTTATVNAPIAQQSADTLVQVGLFGNSNLTLAPITAGTVHRLAIESTSFASPPSISVGNVVRPGTYVSPIGNVSIMNSQGLSLGSIGIGNIEGDLRISDNRGFSDEDASAFAQGRTIGGATLVGGNRP